MELTINIEGKKTYNILMQFLKKLNISVISEKKPKKKKTIKADAVTLLAEKSLAEEWNSKEDDAWDEVL